MILVQVGEKITYNISFIMPTDLTNLEYLRIVDDIPAGLAFESASLQIGSLPAIDVTPNVVVTAGEASYTLSGALFMASAGQTVTFTIVFLIESVTGPITNRVSVYFKPVGEGEELAGGDDTTVVPVTKTATPNIFTANGDEINYTISFPMPADVSDLDHVRIEDVLPSGLALLSTNAILSINGTTQTVMLDNSVAGVVSYIIRGANLAASAGRTVTLTISCVVNDWTGGAITNTANVYFKPVGRDEKPGGSGQTTINYQSPSPPVEVGIQACKISRGNYFPEPGIFHFGIFDENGTLVVTATNGTSRKIVFPTLSFNEPGIYTFTIKELAPANNCWLTDNREHIVTVIVSYNEEGDLQANVVYQGGSIPNFYNEYICF